MAIENDAGAAAPPSSTELALDRTLLAHDRTLMAWVRTATSLISFGFTIYKFFQYLREQQGLEPDGRVLGPRRSPNRFLNGDDDGRFYLTPRKMWDGL